jgi:TolB-like protein/Tfp pilus assembly protein PilF
MEYFADGMTSELITELASIPQLRVVSYTSVMQEKGKRNSLADIARRLGVDAIAEGSVERWRNRIRLNIQLIDVRTDRHLWAQSFDDTADDVLALQQHVAAEIAAHAQVLLTPSMEARLGEGQRLDPAAYDGYLQGRYLLNKRDSAGAVPMFRKAVALDPNYARAWAGLAAGLSDLAMGTPYPRRGPVKEAKAAAEYAIELDPQTGEAWSTLGLLAMLWEWDWKTAEHDLQRAIALSPGDSAAQLNYATYLSMVGRHDEAVSHMRRALELDPLSFFNVRHMGSVLYWARRYDEALEYLGKAREMEPELGGFTEWWVSDSYEMKGMRAEAVLAELREVADSESSRTSNALLATYRIGGPTAYWQSRARMAKAQKPSGECPAFEMALLYRHLGRSGEMLKQLKEMVNDHCFEATMLKTEPMFDSLHGDPRYQALIQEVRLPPGD